MKTFGKYLVMARVKGFENIDKPRLAHPGFMTRKEAVETLDRIFSRKGKKLDKNLWEDSLGQQFWIEKNTKEY